MLATLAVPVALIIGAQSPGAALPQSVVPATLRPAWIAQGSEVTPRTLAASMEEHHVPAVGLAVIKNGNVFGSEVVGAPSDTVFQAASLSKPVAAVAALLLVQRGKLKLDAPLTRAGNWPLPVSVFTESKRPTLRQLLSHTSGLGVSGFFGYEAEPLPALDDMLDGKPPANSSAMFFEAEPGSTWRYSGGGYLVIQKLIEGATGQPYAQFVAREIFAPAKMTSSGFGPGPPFQGHDGLGLPMGFRLYPELAAAGLWTTPRDYARFLCAIPKILNDATRTEFLRPGMNAWGLGVRVNGDWVSHTGRNWGYDAEFRVTKDFSRGVVMFINANSDTGFLAELGSAVITAQGWPDESKFAPRTYHPLDGDDAAKFVGNFVAQGSSLEIKRDHFRFALAINGGPWKSATPTAVDTLESAFGVLKLTETGVALKVGNRQTDFRKAL